MGVVYRARQRKLGRVVAVKMLRSGAFAAKAELQRFELEAKAAARLRHPNIVAIHEVGQHSGKPFFSMDYIQGRSLAQIVRRTPLPPLRAARYVRILADAVHFAHTQGVVHRDLKPGNVLIDAHDVPHITDFGLAKELDSDLELTVSGSVLGTPSYMSPEQAAGKTKQIGRATDIYSLGAILYDLLTGRPPFRADSPTETIRQVIELEPAPLRLLNAKVDRDLETICLKCLSKDPERRYLTAEALAADLDRFQRREPIHARPLGRLTRGYRWAKRHPMPTAFFALGALLTILLGRAAYYSQLDALEWVQAASDTAELMGLRLREPGERVTRMADDPQLILMLRTNAVAAEPRLQRSLENPYVRRLQSLLEAFGGGWFDNVTIVNATGDLLGNYNPRGATNVLPNLNFRDYVQGALRGTNTFYISRVYKSLNDTAWKLGVSIAIRDGTNCLGVLSGTMGTRSTDPPTASEPTRRKIVLVAAVDPNDPQGGPLYRIFWHPGYHARQTKVVPIHHRCLDALLSMPPNGTNFLTDTAYYDPVSAGDPRYTGRWVAGFARVPGTFLVVIYQTRDRVFELLVFAGVGVVMLALVGIGWFIRSRLVARRGE